MKRPLWIGSGWSAFGPHQASTPPAEAARIFLGSALGLAVTLLLCRMIAHGAAWPVLMAPIGASAVLTFAVPASPLAQPWNVVVGNLVSALIGVTVARWVEAPALAAPIAVALAIAAMALLRCLHPPGGAVALTAVIGGPVITAAGYAFAFTPIALNSVVLVGAAMLFHALTGHAYPHVAAAAPSHGTRDRPPLERIGFTPADLDAAARRYGDLLDVSPEDLGVLFQRLETEAFARLHAQVTCAAIMSRDVVTLTQDDDAATAQRLLAAHDLSVLPVVDADGRPVGVVRPADLLRGPSKDSRLASRDGFHAVQADTPIDTLLPLLGSGKVREALIVDAQGRLVGLVTQSDMLAAILRSGALRAMAGEGLGKAQGQA